MPSNNSTPEAWELYGYTLVGLKKDSKGTLTQFDYDPNGYEFRLVADVFYHAVNVFCRRQSQEALEQLGLKVVKEWETADSSFTWMGDKSKMKQYVQAFKQAIKGTPPAICVDPYMKGAYAKTEKLPNYKGNLENVMARSLFRMRLPFKLVDGLKRAYMQTTTDAVPYQSMRMLLILTFWHELCHGFVRYLAGELSKRTPPKVSVSWNDEQRANNIGESGDYMECMMWGGAVEVDRFPDPATPWPSLYLRIDSRTPTFKRITTNIIKGFNDDPWNYDLKSHVEALKECPAPATLAGPVETVLPAGNTAGSANKLTFWNVRFKPVKGKHEFNIEKKQTTRA